MIRLKWRTTVISRDLFKPTDSVFICTDYSDFKIIRLSDSTSAHLKDYPSRDCSTILCGNVYGAWLKVSEEEWKDKELEKFLIESRQGNYSFLPPVPILKERKTDECLRDLTEGEWLLLIEGYKGIRFKEGHETYLNLSKTRDIILNEDGVEVAPPDKIEIHWNRADFYNLWDEGEEVISVSVSDRLLKAVATREKEIGEGE